MAAKQSGMKKPSLKIRAGKQLLTTLTFVGVMLLLPANSLRFWQAWIFLFLMSASWIYFLLDLLHRDPELLDRRLRKNEPHLAQKLIVGVSRIVLFAGFVLAGLDFRFGWTRARLGRIPWSVIAAGQLSVVIGYWFVFRVTKANSFAGSTIQVDEGQRVVQAGPYALVRHPMYFGIAITELATPFALASYVALPVFALIVPILVVRLIDEERMLHRELPGYAEYCQRTRFRLVPGVW